MEKSFPFESVAVKGTEYINMKSDVFYSFFLEIMKYARGYKSLVKEISKQYEYAKGIKKKRMRLKKEKEALLLMYDILVDNFIKK